MGNVQSVTNKHDNEAEAESRCSGSTGPVVAEQHAELCVSVAGTLDDARKSRRTRLATLSPQALLLLGRESLFLTTCNRSSAHVMRVLEHAAARGCEGTSLGLPLRGSTPTTEAAWLVGLLSPMPEFGSMWTRRRDYIITCLSSDDSARSKYYHARTLNNEHPHERCRLLSEAAAGTFPPAMGQWGAEMKDKQAGLKMLQAAKDLGDPQAAYHLACMAGGGLAQIIQLLQEAVDLGSAVAGQDLCSIAGFRDVVPVHVLASYWAKWIAFLGPTNSAQLCTPSCLDLSDPSVQYVVGRELAGFMDEIWDSNDSSPSELIRCVDHYLNVTHALRTAALQGWAILTLLGLPKDLARLIVQPMFLEGLRVAALPHAPGGKCVFSLDCLSRC
jgi:hypothetical protein